MQAPRFEYTHHDWLDDAATRATKDATKALLKDAEENGLDVLGFVDYSTMKMPELAFKLDTLKHRLDAHESRLECLENNPPKPPSTRRLTLLIKRLMIWPKRVMLKR